MLPKPERLTTRDFATLRPKVVFRGTYVDVAAYGLASGISRFACIISKKRIKRAVDRNKARRKIYHILANNKPNTPQLIVVYPKLTVLAGNSALVEEEIRQSFATL